MRISSKLGIILVATVTALASAACSNKDEHAAAASKQPATAPAAEGAQAATGAVDMATARAEFKNRCSSCHGEAGKGNGPAAAALNPKPRDYTNVAWQKSVTDDQIKKTILMGGAAVGKSPIMPASPDLESNPQLLNGIVAIVRDFNGK